MVDVPFLPWELLLVACSTFLCLSLCFWDTGEVSVEHPILVQKSSGFSDPSYGQFLLQGSQRLAIIGQILVLILLLCMGKE